MSTPDFAIRIEVVLGDEFKPGMAMLLFPFKDQEKVWKVFDGIVDHIRGEVMCEEQFVATRKNRGFWWKDESCPDVGSGDR